MSAEEQIEELKQSILSKVLHECESYFRSLKSAKVWKTLGVPIDGMSTGSDPFDESGYEPPGGLFGCGDLKVLSRKFGFPNKLKVIRTNGTTQDDWTLNCFNLWITVARNAETNELIFYENGKPIWVYEVKSPCGTLSKKLEIHNLELNCEKDDFETIAKIRLLTDLCNIISGHTEFPTASFGNNLKCGDNSHYDSSDDDSDDDDEENYNLRKMSANGLSTNKYDNIISTKKGIMDKCCVAVKHTTKENSLNDLNNGLCVYLTKKDTTGENDIFASYVQCSKYPNQEGNTLCHLHLNMNPEKLIKMEDLIKISVKASIDHKYYQSYVDKKAELFLSEIFVGKSEEISKLREFYFNNNHVPTSCLELVGLERFVNPENPTTIPTQWTSKKDYVFTGNPEATWTFYKNTISFVETKTGGYWECLFLSCFDNVRSGSIEVLRTGLAPEDHFRVYTFIKLLNIIRSETLDS